MKAPSKTKKILAGANLALALVAWFALAPRELGGSVSYVITHGISMNPRIQEGDLVLVRKASTYERGDVIAYDSEALKRPVMHRIVAGGPAGYVTKGDNNDWVDSDRPTDADVIGKEWLHIPKAGRILAYAGTPVGAAALAGLGGLLVFAGHSMSRTRRRRRTTMPQMPKIDTSKLAGLDVTRQIGFGAVALGIVASLMVGYRSLTADPVDLLPSGSTYAHTGRWTYSADAPVGPAYPDGKATTGEPLFLNLIDELDVTFSYALKTEASADIAGKAGLWVRVTDGTGWKRSFPLQTQTAFTGPEVELRGTLDPRAIQNSVAEVQKQTGVISTPIVVTLVPTIAIEGVVDGHTLEDSFVPNLALTLDGPQMNLATASGAAADPASVHATDPLKPREDKDIGGARVTPAEVSFLGLKTPVRTARLGAFFGLAASLAAGWWLWNSRKRREEDDEDARIAARYRDWLIPVAPRATHAAPAIEVTDMEGLARLAERYERMILHSTNGTGHRYMVEDAGVLYYYETRTKTEPAAEAEAPTAPTPVEGPTAAAEATPESLMAQQLPLDKPAAKASSKTTEKAPTKKVAEKKVTSARKRTVARKTSSSLKRRPPASS
ncbi:MAG: signal peptidase I [Actinomycetota bacterium]|nr:signal peptidase I [Actinomycetota bacterium]